MLHRSSRLLGGAIATSLLVLTSCGAYWPMSAELEERIHAEASALKPSIGDDEAVRDLAERTVRGEVPPPEAFPLADGAGLEDYVRLALMRNPRIHARVRDIEALGMRVPQVTSLGDPVLSFVPPTASMMQTAAGEMQAAVGATQGIPFPPKLAAMGSIAEQVVRMAFENLRSERLAVVAEVKKAHAAYYQAAITIQVTRELLQGLLSQLHGAAEARYRAGSVPQQDVLRAEVELYSLANELITYEQELSTAQARLNVLMDRAVNASLPRPATPEPEQLGLKLLPLMARAAANNPALAELQQRVQHDLEAVHLAKLQYFPDLSLGGLFTFIGGGISPVANGNDVWNLNVGVTLPIWFHRLRAGVLERNAETLSSALRWRSTRNDIFFAVQDLLVRVDSDYRSVVLLRDGILPRARQTIDVSRSGYEAGRVDFTTLVESWQRLLDLTLAYHRALATFAQDLAELERVVGGALPRSRT